jgi:hypothetical protein
MRIVKPRKALPSGSGCWERRERRARQHGMKAKVVGEALGTCNRRGLRGHRGRHDDKERTRKLGTTRGQPRRTRTAKAPRINRRAVKSRCAGEWGAWGRLSVDGPGHYNPDRSEGPWGRATSRCSNGGAPPVRPSGTERNTVSHPRSMTRRARRAHTNRRSDGYAGCRLNRSLEREGTA